MSAPDIAPKFDYDEAVAKRFLANQERSGGLHEFLGFVTVGVGPGTMHGRFTVRDELLTGFGNMHGGVLSAFCDHLLGTVCYPVMRKGQWAATTEFKINLTRPVTQGEVDGYATILSFGRTQAVARIDVHNAGRLCALAQGTVTIMNPR